MKAAEKLEALPLFAYAHARNRCPRRMPTRQGAIGLMDSQTPRRGATLDEVARLAGVSRAAASRAINNAPDVSRAKRDAVAKAVRELGYFPNTTARALATNRVGAIILAVSNEDPTLFADPFFAQVVVGVNTALEQTDLALMLIIANSTHGRGRLERALRSRRADGVLLMALQGDDPLNHLVADAHVPVVIGGRPLHGDPEWYVDADNRGGARMATEHLIASGRRRIATITGPLNTQVAVARFQSFREALAVAGQPAHRYVHADFTERAGAEAMTTLLTQHPDLDAVFAANDNMAAGALRVLRQSGRSVPEDVAVVGFDDLGIAQHTNPTLTSVHQPIQALGFEMARMLMTVIDGGRPSPLILPTRLIIRDSAPKPAG
jgi:DNA-binding LacI/PurR family transcriptional regulator